MTVGNKNKVELKFARSPHQHRRNREVRGIILGCLVYISIQQRRRSGRLHKISAFLCEAFDLGNIYKKFFFFLINTLIYIVCICI